MAAHAPGEARALLARVQEGMAVQDRTGKKIGKVAQCYLGGESLADLGEAAVAAGSVLAGVPRALRSRLAAEGFVEIAPGVLGAHRYATAGQLAAVEGDQLRLSVERADLAKR
jgi:hypothetical protein